MSMYSTGDFRASYVSTVTYCCVPRLHCNISYYILQICTRVQRYNCVDRRSSLI